MLVVFVASKIRKFTIIKCKDCDVDIRVRNDYLTKHKHLCKKCQNRGKPFEAQYNRMIQQNKDWGGNITFQEFLEFTKITKCHYCLNEIKWYPYRYNYLYGVKSKDIVRYNLDRKDSFKGYDINNLVVCCSRCNYGKSNIYTYEEWFGMTKYFRDLSCPIR